MTLKVTRIRDENNGYDDDDDDDGDDDDDKATHEPSCVEYDTARRISVFNIRTLAYPCMFHANSDDATNGNRVAR